MSVIFKEFNSAHGSYSQRKSGKNQKIRKSQGKSKYQHAKVNKDEEKSYELFYADCIQQFNFFSARFVRRLFVSPFCAQQQLLL